jgi:abequosyltransferase
LCIPTYNRAKIIAETLDSIISQLTDEVEIVISDNASPDNTKEIIYRYKQQHTNITYFCWEKNMGADKNFMKVVELAQGEYCWFISDDDTLKPGAVNIMLSEINSGHDIYMCNETTCDINLKAICDRNRINSNLHQEVFHLDDEKDLILFFDNSDPVGGIPFGFISVLAFKRSKWLSINYDESFTGSGYSHVFMLLSFSKIGGTLKYINAPLVFNRSNNISYISLNYMQVFWITADGYIALAEKLMSDNQKIKSAFLHIAKRIYTWRRIMGIRRVCVDIDDWDKVERRLIQFGHNANILRLIRHSKGLITLLSILKKPFCKTRNIVKSRV